jgi:hypothetical protein
MHRTHRTTGCLLNIALACTPAVTGARRIAVDAAANNVATPIQHDQAAGPARSVHVCTNAYAAEVHMQTLCPVAILCMCVCS